ncbi:ATP-binding protein [Epibacterium ulvae]|uniref:ATP-binding protein n=1 Tax=Epibacterium ulvae TaxID=1156985 RepID=UPI001BFC8FB7|nr:ATP-binding protein [Epibacterium ulvae]MBT8154307.1 ATP-binding protein [Epibacterium ulvae]
MNIDFKAIRTIDGKASTGFEELVCQLAALEPVPGGARFHRKGTGKDGGLECFTRFSDGTECGWQAKYSWRFDNNLERSLNSSVKSALKKHPNLTKICVCLPFDRSDPFSSNETQLEAFERWRNNEVAEAAKQDRQLEIDLWDASALKTKLTNPSGHHAGRIRYWFESQFLSPVWFQDQFERSKAALGHRYTHETSVEIPIRRALLGATRNPELLTSLRNHRSELREACNEFQTTFVLSREDADTMSALGALLDDVDELPHQTWPVDHWRNVLDQGLDIIERKYHDEIREAYSTSSDEKKTKKNQTHDARRALEKLERVSATLQARAWEMAVIPHMLITGEAGSGKSHLLADACSHQLNKKRPAVLLLGGQLTDAEIWPQISSQLGLPLDYTRDQLLGALDAAGEAAGVRAMLCIDAINERKGGEIWPSRLAAFLKDAEAYPNVVIVLSCRSTYLAQIVPSHLDDTKLPRLEHSGFSMRDARKFLSLRNILLLDQPFLPNELRNPLFLKVCCDALDRQGKKGFPKGMQGVTEIFKMYRGALCDSVEAHLKLAPRRRYPVKAIEILAKEIATTTDPLIEYDRAAELLAPICGNNPSLDSDLLEALCDEGLLAIEPIRENGEDSEYVRFSFERFGDHVAAQAILDATLINETLPSPLLHDIALFKACSRQGAPQGVLDALAIQLPERTGVELPDAVKDADRWLMSCISRENITLRRRESVTERSFELLEEWVDPDEIWNARIQLALGTDGPFGLNALHQDLLRLPMPERDAEWSCYAGESADDGREGEEELDTPLHDLMDWAMDAKSGSLDDEAATNAAVLLTWCLSTTYRRTRDRATKALVALLIASPQCGQELLRRFDKIDDPYIGERLAAAIYGAALQSAWTDTELATIAQVTANRHFVENNPPVDLLWRDHLVGLIEYSRHRCCALDVPKDTQLQPPFDSPWPLEFAPDMERGKDPRNSETSWDIISSTDLHGDFASYVIKYAVQNWAAGEEGSALPTTEDLYQTWRSEFETSCTEKERALVDELIVLRSSSHDWCYPGTEQGILHKEMEQKLRKLLGDQRYEAYRVRAGHWAMDRSDSWTTDRAAHFDLGWAQRWICRRAHDLGWKAKLHAGFDRNCSGDRMNHTKERIGKKYQWIALRELMARISDHCGAVERDRPQHLRETVRRLRDMDPSHLMTKSHDWGWAKFDEPTFWMPKAPLLSPRSVEEAWEWLDSERDFLDGEEFLDFQVDEQGLKWTPLRDFQSFSGVGASGEAAHIRTKTWRRSTCFLVRNNDLAGALQHLDGQMLTTDHDLGFTNEASSEDFLGELGWRTDTGEDWITEWARKWIDKPTPAWTMAPVEGLCPTMEFLQEASGYNHSLKQNLRVILPCSWLMRNLNMSLKDGRDLIYTDTNGSEIFKDPSASKNGPSTALVNRDAFVRLLSDREFAPIWVIGGGKELYSDKNDAFGQRWFTSTWTLEDGTFRKCSLETEEDRRREGEGSG